MKPTKTVQEEISALEAEISYHKKLLDQAITEDQPFEKTKAIFHELKEVNDKLALLKKQLLNKA